MNYQGKNRLFLSFLLPVKGYKVIRTGNTLAALNSETFELRLLIPMIISVGLMMALILVGAVLFTRLSWSILNPLQKELQQQPLKLFRTFIMMKGRIMGVLPA